MLSKARGRHLKKTIQSLLLRKDRSKCMFLPIGDTMELFKFGLTKTDNNILHALRVEPSSISQLAWICECSRRTIQRSIKKLLGKDVIEEAYTLARNEKVYQLIGGDNDE